MLKFRFQREFIKTISILWKVKISDSTLAIIMGMSMILNMENALIQMEGNSNKRL